MCQLKHNNALQHVLLFLAITISVSCVGISAHSFVIYWSINRCGLPSEKHRMFMRDAVLEDRIILATWGSLPFTQIRAHGSTAFIAVFCECCRIVFDNW